MVNQSQPVRRYESTLEKPKLTVSRGLSTISRECTTVSLMASRCRGYGSLIYKSSKFQLSGKKNNCKRARCITVALLLTMGSPTASREVTMEQNPETSLFWNCNNSTFTVSFSIAYN